MPAKPTGCIILSPPCACRFIVIASFGYAYRFTVMHMVRSIPCRCYLSEKKNGLIQHAEQVVFAYVTDVLDMFPLHEPESRTINCMQLSSFYAKRKSPSDQVWKQSERLLIWGSESILSRIFFLNRPKGRFFYTLAACLKRKMLSQIPSPFADLIPFGRYCVSRRWRSSAARDCT